MGEATAKQKSKQFAVRIVRLPHYLCKEKQEYTLSKQIFAQRNKYWSKFG